MAPKLYANSPLVLNKFQMTHQKLSYTPKCKRFIERLSRQCPEHYRVKMIVAHQYFGHRSYNHAAKEYLLLLKHCKDNQLCTGIYRPMIARIYMFLGVCYLHHAQKRMTRLRTYNIIQAFSLFSEYLNKVQYSAEGFYNLGRAFHFVNLVHLAQKFYTRALVTATSAQINAKPSDDDHRTRQRLRNLSIQREAAHNLALIYKNSGSVELAAEIVNRYIVIE